MSHTLFSQQFLVTSGRCLADALAAEAADAGISGEAFPTLREAVEKAKTYGHPVFICGSLYLYADLDRENG